MQGAGKGEAGGRVGVVDFREHFPNCVPVVGVRNGDVGEYVTKHLVGAWVRTCFDWDVLGGSLVALSCGSLSGGEEQSLGG